MNIYVGNLSFNANEDDLRGAFETYGQVEDVKIIKDKYTGGSKGFAFVEMSAEAEALSAIEGLNGKDFKGRTLVVNKARPRSEGRSRGGGRRRSY
jgi:RNA recognition motif-containing protein